MKFLAEMIKNFSNSLPMRVGEPARHATHWKYLFTNSAIYTEYYQFSFCIHLFAIYLQKSCNVQLCRHNTINFDVSKKSPLRLPAQLIQGSFLYLYILFLTFFIITIFSIFLAQLKNIDFIGGSSSFIASALLSVNYFWNDGNDAYLSVVPAFCIDFTDTLSKWNDGTTLFL